MKKCFLLPAFVFFIQVLNGQNRIIQSSDSLNSIADVTDIKKIKLPWGFWGRNVRVIFNNGKDSLIKRRSIWGFQRELEPVKRFWGIRPYEMVELGEVIIYKVSGGKATSYYFSSDLNSEINPLTRKYLLKRLSKEKYDWAIQKSELLKGLVG